MTNRDIEPSQRTAARIVGFTLILGFALAIFGQFYLSSGLLVPHDAAQTARNILAHETRFRLYAVCNLLYVIDLLVLVSALYVVLKPANPGLALAAAFCRLVYALLWIITVLNLFGALWLLHGADYLQAIAPEQLHALAKTQIRGGFDDYYVGLPFFALASTITAWLWLKSGYLPKALAAFGVLASTWGVACGLVFLVFPHFDEVVNDWWFDTPLGLFELATGFWLLFIGLKPLVAAQPARANVA